MRDFIKKYTFAMLALGVFPIIVYIIFVNTFKSLTGGELAVLIGAILAYYGTVFLGIVAVYQNESLKKLNEKLLQLERGDRATFISFDNDDIDFTIYFEKKEADNENITVFLAEYNKTSDVNDSITLELSLLNTSKHYTNVDLIHFELTQKQRNITVKALSCESKNNLIFPNASKKALIYVKGLEQYLTELWPKMQAELKPDGCLGVTKGFLFNSFNFKMVLSVTNMFAVTTTLELDGYALMEVERGINEIGKYSYELFCCGYEIRN